MDSNKSQPCAERHEQVACDAYLTSLALDPWGNNNVNGHRELAAILTRQKEYDKSQLVLEEGLAKNSANRVLLLAPLVNLYQQKPDLKRATALAKLGNELAMLDQRDAADPSVLQFRRVTMQQEFGSGFTLAEINKEKSDFETREEKRVARADSEKRKEAVCLAGVWQID